ncbi:unnamed protein product, partial [Nesidiocoris tenuis]
MVRTSCWFVTKNTIVKGWNSDGPRYIRTKASDRRCRSNQCSLPPKFPQKLKRLRTSKQYIIYN